MIHIETERRIMQGQTYIQCSCRRAVHAASPDEAERQHQEHLTRWRLHHEAMIALGLDPHRVDSALGTGARRRN